VNPGGDAELFADACLRRPADRADRCAIIRRQDTAFKFPLRGDEERP
jgi:hypothetical protein